MAPDTCLIASFRKILYINFENLQQHASSMLKVSEAGSELDNLKTESNKAYENHRKFLQCLAKN